jgi:hypothetical protein
MVHGFCHPCWRQIQKERQAVVAEKLAMLDEEEP